MFKPSTYNPRQFWGDATASKPLDRGAIIKKHLDDFAIKKQKAQADLDQAIARRDAFLGGTV